MNKILILIVTGIFLINFVSADYLLFYNSSINVGIRSYFPFDYSTIGNSPDIGSLHNNITSIGTMMIVPSLINNSLNYVSGWSYTNTTFTTGSQAKSFNIWFNISNPSVGTQFMFMSGEGTIRKAIGLYSSASELYFASYSDDVKYTGTTLASNTWYMATMTYDGTTAKLYMNGNNTVNYTIALDTATVNNITIGKRSDNSAGQFTGAIDQFIVWNRTLSPEEVNAIYNQDRNNITVTEGKSSDTKEINLNYPSNNFAIYNNTINFAMNATPSVKMNLTNFTIYIWDKNSNLITKINKTITGNITNSTIFNITSWDTYNNDIYYWNTLVCMKNTTLTTCEFDSSNFTFRNYLTLEIRDYFNNYITDGQLYTDYSLCTNYICNINAPTYFNGYDKTNITINASSKANKYRQNDTTSTINITYNNTYTIYLKGFNLALLFTKNNQPMYIRGKASDNETSLYFYNTTYITDQGVFNPTKVFINLLINKTSGTSEYINSSQYFEYDNSLNHDINETIEIMQNPDILEYIQVQDNSNNLIKNAKLTLYGVKPVNATNQAWNYTLYGQRFTDKNGITSFILDSSIIYYIRTVADGYETDVYELNGWEAVNEDYNDPKLIRISSSGYSTKNEVYLGGLYKVKNSIIYENPFDDVTADYLLFLTDDAKRDLLWSTSYQQTNKSISLNSQNTGEIKLTSGTDFNSNVGLNQSFYLYIYADDELVYNFYIKFQNQTSDTIINTEDIGIKDSSSFRAIIFVLLIFVSGGIALMINTTEGDLGMHTFFIGTFILPIMVSGIGWLTWTGAIFYFGKTVKRMVSE